jgi:hypothetical protein
MVRILTVGGDSRRGCKKWGGVVALSCGRLSGLQDLRRLHNLCHFFLNFSIIFARAPFSDYFCLILFHHKINR